MAVSGPGVGSSGLPKHSLPETGPLMKSRELSGGESTESIRPGWRMSVCVYRGRWGELLPTLTVSANNESTEGLLVYTAFHRV